MTSSYYRGANGVLLVYDVSNRETFENIADWVNEVDRYVTGNVTKIIIGNKTDLQTTRAITLQEGQKLSEELGLTFMETSAKEGTNINEIFSVLTKLVVDKWTSTQQRRTTIVDLNKPVEPPKKSKCFI